VMADRKRIEDKFRILFEAAPNGVMTVDAAGCIVLVNAQMETMFGYAREDLIGQPVEVLVPQRFRRNHVVLRKGFAAAPRMRPMGTNRDLIGLHKDGTEFPIEVGLNPTGMSRGDAVIATVVDITERNRAKDEANIHAYAREKLQVFQQLGMPAAVLRQDGQVILTNSLFKNLDSQFVFKGDRVEVADPTANELFKQELACLDRRNHDEIVYSRPVLAERDHSPLIFHLLPMEGSIGRTLGVLVVTTLDALGVPLTSLVEKLFALAPAEARVAALIGSGLSPRRAAEQIGISEKNLRTTLQHVFAKIGVSRQSELAVLLTKLTLG